MFNDPDWYADRFTSTAGSVDSSIIRIDLQHIRPEVLAIVLQHCYHDAGPDDLFERQEFARADEKIDFVMLVMSAANELLLDRLKAACSVVVRPLSKLHVGI